MDIIAFDQQLTLALNGSDLVWLDQVIMTFTKTLTWIPAGLLMLWIAYRHTTLRQFIAIVGLLALCILCSDQLSSLFKHGFQRWRPAQDPELGPLVDVVNGYRGGRYGFFSAHASNTLSVALMFALIFRHRLTTAMLIFWSLLNCYTRVYLGVHYVGDITVGLCFGTMWGLLFYAIYRRWFSQPLLSETTLTHTRSQFPKRDLLWLNLTLAATILVVLIIS